MSFDQDINNLNFTPDHGDVDSADGFARIIWLSTTKTQGVVGKFYAKQDVVGAMQAPWEAVERFDDEAGFETSRLRIVPIRKRSQAYTEVTVGGLRSKTWETHYKPNAGMRIYTELLCYVEGYDELVVWPIKGLVGRAVTAKTGSVFSDAKAVLAEAKKTAKGAIPEFAFWVPIAAPIGPKGKVVTTSTGYGSDVVLPQYDIASDTISRQTCVDLYVGKSMLAKAATAYADSADWARAQRVNEAPTEGFDQGIVSKSIQHNVIKPIEDDSGIF
jgi:hypothetical protein